MDTPPVPQTNCFPVDNLSTSCRRSDVGLQSSHLMEVRLASLDSMSPWSGKEHQRMIFDTFQIRIITAVIKDAPVWDTSWSDGLKASRLQKPLGAKYIFSKFSTFLVIYQQICGNLFLMSLSLHHLHEWFNRYNLASWWITIELLLILTVYYSNTNLLMFHVLLLKVSISMIKKSRTSVDSNEFYKAS